MPMQPRKVEDHDLTICDHLVVVCCHAIWRGGPTIGEDEREWILEPFQAGESPTFLGHIKAGLDVCLKDERAMVVFSGGATKPHLTSFSEGESYCHLATRLNSAESARLHAECFATDSMQNILFSLLLFQKLLRRSPERITVISHDFKRARFIEQHFPTLQWPSAQVDYMGIDPKKDGFGRRQIETGEKKARSQWMRDPWGWGSELGRKRTQRGWKDACLLQLSDELPLRELVKWNGGLTRKKGFPHPLPWTS